MILSDIKRYLQDRKQATLGDLAVHFDTDPEAMRGMLEQWIQKGRVAKSALRANCNRSCSKCCSDATIELYEWRS
jgi:predicted ArsR family transcriptional regulator